MDKDKDGVDVMSPAGMTVCPAYYSSGGVSTVGNLVRPITASAGISTERNLVRPSGGGIGNCPITVPPTTYYYPPQVPVTAYYYSGGRMIPLGSMLPPPVSCQIEVPPTVSCQIKVPPTVSCQIKVPPTANYSPIGLGNPQSPVTAYYYHGGRLLPLGSVLPTVFHQTQVPCTAHYSPGGLGNSQVPPPVSCQIEVPPTVSCQIKSPIGLGNPQSPVTAYYYYGGRLLPLGSVLPTVFHQTQVPSTAHYSPGGGLGNSQVPSTLYYSSGGIGKTVPGGDEAGPSKPVIKVEPPKVLASTIDEAGPSNTVIKVEPRN